MIDRGAIAEALKQDEVLAVADQILIEPNTEAGGLVSDTQKIIDLIRDLSSSPSQQVEALILLGRNLVGRETGIVGYERGEIDRATGKVMAALDSLDPEVQESVVRSLLADMHSVNSGDSLPGLWAERIEKDLDSSRPASSFLLELEKQLLACVYLKMVAGNMGKFGNDYALGLPWMRPFYCQVSTNPVLAWRAYLESLELRAVLKSEIAAHADWVSNPEEHKLEIAMQATLLALWPNLAVFRPLAVFHNLTDYQVSFQLSPLTADSVEESIADAKRANKLAREFLTKYDKLLGLDDEAGKVPPNLVLKVAACHPAALEITRRLNAMGHGTNNTLVYTVEQEARLWIEALKGKAEAAKTGLPVVRTYMTNMPGRLVSHLREQVVIDIFSLVARNCSVGKAMDLLGRLAVKLDVDMAAWESLAPSDIETKARLVCSYKYLKAFDPADQPIILEAAELAGYSRESLEALERALKMAGTFVAQRVWKIFLSPENKEKWTLFIQREYNLSREKAEWVVDSMGYLPASKRTPADTLLALGDNMINTEFPNHGRAVAEHAESADFDLEDYRDSIAREPEYPWLVLLQELSDFCRAYGITQELKDFLVMQVGITDVVPWILGGLEPDEWSSFGPVQKTGCEFQFAFGKFIEMCLEIAREAAS